MTCSTKHLGTEGIRQGVGSGTSRLRSLSKRVSVVKTIFGPAHHVSRGGLYFNMRVFIGIFASVPSHVFMLEETQNVSMSGPARISKAILTRIKKDICKSARPKKQPRATTRPKRSHVSALVKANYPGSEM